MPSSSSRGVLFVSNFLADTIQSRSYMEDLADRLEGAGEVVVRTSRRVGKVARLADMLAATWAARNDVDCAHIAVFSGWAFVWAEAVAFELRRLGKPYVLTLHGGNLPEFGTRWPRRVRRLLASAPIVTAPSDYLCERMRSFRADIEVIPNALDTKRFAFRARKPAAPRLVWLRAFHALYNPTLAIDVLARLRQRHPAASLLMVGRDRGDGSLDAVRDRIAALGLGEAVELVVGAPSADVPMLLDRGDIFINTTDADNTPLSLLEAMGVGLPVVSTNVGGIPFLLSDRRNALLVNARDAEAMTDAITRLVDDPALAHEISRGGRELVEGFDWSRVLPRWHSLLQRLRTPAA